MIQPSLFATDETSHLLIGDIAQQLNVSEASVRNWIKTGYLKQLGRGTICKDSFEFFKTNIAGTDKLTSRANKLQKDNHNHQDLQKKYEELLQSKAINLSDIGTQYELSLSNAYRNQEGIYYTPETIVQQFFDYLPKDCKHLSFCDPCCGSGNFIIAAIQHGFEAENVYGFDVDPIAVEITKRRIFELTGYETNNIVCLDFLKSIKGNKIKPFDVIFTNPPWGKKILKARRELFSSAFGTGTSTDTSSLFFFASLLKLKENGFLGFLLQDAFFNVGSFESARTRALSLKIKALIDFGKPFKGLLTKAKGIVLQNSKENYSNIIACKSGDQTLERTQVSFQTVPKLILNFSCSQEEANVIEHLYELPHTTLLGQAKYGLGIVTGNNKKHCTHEPREGYIPVLKGADIYKDKVNQATNFISDDFSVYQQVAPLELFESKEKLIYRFISSNLVFFYDSEQRYFLNSANMIILNDTFPINTKQLSQLLNSKVLNWLFRKVFETHKVLRSDIESLPLHVQYFNTHNDFTEASFLDFLGIEDTSDGTFRVKSKNL